MRLLARITHRFVRFLARSATTFTVVRERQAFALDSSFAFGDFEGTSAGMRCFFRVADWPVVELAITEIAVAFATFTVVCIGQGYVFLCCLADSDFECALVWVCLFLRITDRLVFTIARATALAFSVVSESQCSPFLFRLTFCNLEGAIVKACVFIRITYRFIFLLAGTTATLATVCDSQFLASFSGFASGNLKRTFIGVS